MNRIATGDSYNASLLGLLNAQNRQAEAGRRVASGLVASDLKGYAALGATLTATQSVKARADQLLENNTVLSQRLAAQDQALGAVSQAVAGASKAVTDAVAVGNGATLIQNLQGWLAQATQGLNADFAGQPLFAGGVSDQAPSDAYKISDLVAPATVASHLHDGALVRSDRIDEGVTVATSFRASDVGAPFLQVLKEIADYDQPPTGPLTGKLTDTQIDFLKSKLAPLTQAADGVRGLVAQNGVTQARVDATVTQISARSDAAGKLISDATQADPAAAATQLQLAGVALQASAQVFSALSGTSLLNVLRS